MARFKSVVLSFTIFFSAGMMAANRTLLVSQKCLACICEAISACDTSGSCSEGVCGTFRMTKPYWSDGGKPTVNNEAPEAPIAFSNCASDVYCSSQTVEGYMQTYNQDCNGDGKIDCDDFVMIHKLGGFGCKGEPLTGGYAKRYELCKATIGV